MKSSGIERDRAGSSGIERERKGSVKGAGEVKTVWARELALKERQTKASPAKIARPDFVVPSGHLAIQTIQPRAKALG